MKAFLALIFCVALAACTTTSGKAFVSVMAELSSRSQHIIDDGLEVLSEMLRAVGHEYHTTIAANDAGLEALSNQLEPLRSEVEQLQNQCMDCDNALAYMEEEYQRNRAFIDWLETRMKANSNRVETLKWLRCESNKEWFNFLKSSKQMLKFVDFMRSALQNYNSFAQIKSFLPKLDFLKNEMEQDVQQMLVQLKEEADQLPESTDVSDEELVLNINEASKSRDFNSVRQQLIEILNNVEKSVKAKMNRSQTNEVISSLKVADFIFQLELESNEFDKTLTQLSEDLSDNPEQALKIKESECTALRERLTKLSIQFNELDSQVNAKRLSNEQVAGRLEHQHSLVVELIDEYVQGVHQVAVDYAVRVQDWVDNQSFDAAPFFDERQLKAQFGNKEAGLNGYVEGIVKGTVKPVGTEGAQIDVFSTEEPQVEVEQLVVGADTVAPEVEVEAAEAQTTSEQEVEAETAGTGTDAIWATEEQVEEVGEPQQAVEEDHIVGADTVAPEPQVSAEAVEEPAVQEPAPPTSSDDELWR